MRGIKFRAWDKQVKRIGQVWEIDIVNEFARYDDENKRYSSQGYDMPIILMEYTGLKDKNGKEIYEGDVLDHPEYGRFVIKHDSYFTGFYLHDSSYPNPREEDVHFSMPEGRNAEVIGNIYEHPHLLE